MRLVWHGLAHHGTPFCRSKNSPCQPFQSSPGLPAALRLFRPSRPLSKALFTSIMYGSTWITTVDEVILCAAADPKLLAKDVASPLPNDIVLLSSLITFRYSHVWSKLVISLHASRLLQPSSCLFRSVHGVVGLGPCSCAIRRTFGPDLGLPSAPYMVNGSFPMVLKNSAGIWSLCNMFRSS